MDDIANRDYLFKEEAEAFIGDMSSYYFEKWETHRYSTTGWNWAAFLLGVVWLVYRRMYVEIYLIFVILIGIYVNGGLLFGFDFLGKAILYLLPYSLLFIPTLLGVFGNALYRQKGLRILNEIKSFDESERITLLRDKGGINIVGAIIVFICHISAAYFVFFF